MKKIAHTFICCLVLFSCGSKKNDSLEKLTNRLVNQLMVTDKGDSLEIGYWEYNNEKSKISKNGYYENGYKVGEWKYKNLNDSMLVFWEIYDYNNVKFNFPKKLKISETHEFPVLFLADIVDGDKNTYVALLAYSLDEMNSNVFDYLYQANRSRENNSAEILKSKKIKKYLFKNLELFKYQVEVDRESRIYQIVSYIFEVNGKLYDFTYKNIGDEIGSLTNEIINDMLYSMTCQGEDLFTNNTGKYYKEESVVFK